MKSKLKKYFILTIALIYLFFVFFFTCVSLFRYNNFQVFFYDFGIFARIIWQLSRFKLPYINHLVLGKVFFLGDHFNPSLIILAPLFWLTSNLRILLFEQALVTVLSGVMIFLIAKKNKLSLFLSFSLSLAFLIFAGTENPLVTDWHPESTAGFFLLLFFYFFNFTNFKVFTYVLALNFLGFKESNALSFIPMLIWLFLIKKERHNEIIGLITVSIIWFLISVKFIIPLFSGRPYMYTPKIPTNIIEIVANFFNPEIKRQFIYNCLISFGFLPVSSYLGLLPIIGELVIRFIPSFSMFQNFTLGFHYNVYIGIFLSLASIYGTLNIKRIFKKSAYLELLLTIYILIISVYTARKITFSPINLTINSTFWKEIKGRQDLISAVNKIPKTGSVMAQNNILPHLVARKDEVYMFSSKYDKFKPDTITFDLTSGQNPNNFWECGLNYIIFKKDELINNSVYRRILVDNPNFYIFIKK